MTTMAVRRGGDWLISNPAPDEILTPERLSPEHRLIGRTAIEFAQKEVLPALDRLESKDWAVARRLLIRAGELGLMGTDVPEDLGGVALDKASSIVVIEALSSCAAFSTTFGGQTGLTIIPILCFGTHEQRQRYLPRIVTGELVGAYCLSESGSGSDALSVRTRAVRQPDGSWLLNGEKMWITNGGFADIFIVFAKVDGEQFSAFIVERGFPGVTTGNEEHKMGLHGSSTTPLLLQDARVPAENLLGEIGKGHKIAFNVLNYGRFKLAAMCSGAAKAAIAEAAAYAAARRQFGQPIASFGAIRRKLADMTIAEFAVESMLFRTAGLIDGRIGDAAHDAGAVAAALEEFAIESSLLKVAGSEMADFVIDEDVQIHGGNGFVRDYPAERRYRDARVNRIFEGTNEINRLLVPTMLMRRAVKGGNPLLQAAKDAQDALFTISSPPSSASAEPLSAGQRTVEALKKTALVSLGLARQTYGDGLEREQEIVMMISDIIMDTFAAESALLRAEQARRDGHRQASLQADAAVVICHDASLRVEALARTLLAAMLSGDTLRTSLAGLRHILDLEPTDTIAPRRRLADAVTAAKRYAFE